MVELALSVVAATHFWINGQNTLVTVCKYYAKPEVSRRYYFHPYTKVIPFDEECPATVKVPN